MDCKGFICWLVRNCEAHELKCSLFQVQLMVDTSDLDEFQHGQGSESSNGDCDGSNMTMDKKLQYWRTMGVGELMLKLWLKLMEGSTLMMRISGMVRKHGNSCTWRMCNKYIIFHSFASGMANHSWHHKYSNEWDIQAYEKKIWSQKVIK